MRSSLAVDTVWNRIKRKFNSVNFRLVRAIQNYGLKYFNHIVQVSNIALKNKLWITQFWPENKTAEETASLQLASLHQDEAEDTQTAQPEIPFENKENLPWTKLNIWNASVLLFIYIYWATVICNFGKFNTDKNCIIFWPAWQHVYSIMKIWKSDCEQNELKGLNSQNSIFCFNQDILQNSDPKPSKASRQLSHSFFMASQYAQKEITSEFKNNTTDYMFASKLLKTHEIKFFVTGMIFFLIITLIII